MLTDAEYEILSFVQNEHSRKRTDILNHFIRDTAPARTDALIKNLADGGLIRMDLAQNVRVTPSGVSAMSMYEQIRDERADQSAAEIKKEVQRVKDRKQDRRDKWLVSIVSACCGSVLTLCVEHFDVLLVFLGKIFH